MAGSKLKLLKVLLRLLASLATFCAAMVMLFAHQTAIFVDSSIHVNFGDLAAYWCFVFANFVVCIYCILVSCLNSKSLLWRLVVALDAVLVVIITSSCSAALAVAYLEISGNFHAHWTPICHMVPSYCSHVFGAIIVGFVGSISYLILHLLSIHEALDVLLIK